MMLSRTLSAVFGQQLRRCVPRSAQSLRALSTGVAPLSSGGQAPRLAIAAGGAAVLAAAVAATTWSTAQAEGAAEELPGLIQSDAYSMNIVTPKYPKEVPVFIEVAQWSRMKYEWDTEINALRLDRVLHSAVFYPHSYGFIPQTLCGDGDPLDVLVICDGPLQPGSVVDVRPIAYMIMEDEKGKDEKVLAVCAKDPRYMDVRTLRDMPEHTLREIAHFFETYKALEKDKWVRVGGWKGTEDTRLLIEQTHHTYLEDKKAKKAAGK